MGIRIDEPDLMPPKVIPATNDSAAAKAIVAHHWDTLREIFCIGLRLLTLWRRSARQLLV
jgi:hypothetical protein